MQGPGNPPDDPNLDRDEQELPQPYEKEQTTQETIRALITNKQFYYCKEFDRLYHNYEPATQYDLNTLYNEYLVYMGQKHKTPYNRFEQIIASEGTAQDHPVHRYLDSCRASYPKHVPGDPIREVFNLLKLGPTSEAHKALLYRMFRKWALQFVLQPLMKGEASGALVLVIVGETGRGKDKFFQMLLPPELRDSFHREIEFDYGDGNNRQYWELMGALVEQWLIVDSEWQGFKRNKDMKLFKRITGSGKVKWRPSGASRAGERNDVRLANFAGTSNDTQLTNDQARNRRIIPIETDQVDWQALRDFDHRRFYAKLLQIYDRAGADRCFPTDSEIDQLDALTSDFKTDDYLDDAIRDYCHPDPDAPLWNEQQILQILTQATSRSFRMPPKGRMKEALARHGITTSRPMRNGKRVRGGYAVDFKSMRWRTNVKPMLPGTAQHELAADQYRPGGTSHEAPPF